MAVGHPAPGADSRIEVQGPTEEGGGMTLARACLPARNGLWRYEDRPIIRPTHSSTAARRAAV